jgi:hypothetical protein
MKFLSVAFSAALALVACAPVVPSETPTLTSPSALWAENRGGPALAFQIGGTVVTTVACDDGAALIPGQDGVPSLPWDLEIIRVGDGTIVAHSTVTNLSQYFVQIGETDLGPSTIPILGPAGPSCPPSP